MKNINFITSLIILLLAILGCGGGQSGKDEEKRSGRLRYVENLHFGSVGSHGSQGWYVNNRHIYVNDKEYTPDGIKMDEIACDASPNPAVEALRCSGGYREVKISDDVKTFKQNCYILRMKNNQPEWVMAPDANGLWVGDGHWLLYKDFYFNVETSEQKTIKGLPEYPEKYFMAASPDLGTIIYEEDSFYSRYDLPPGANIEEEKDKQREIYKKHRESGITAFWLIDTATGKVEILEVPKEKYDWANPQKFYYRSERLESFQKQLVWEKDKSGKDQLVFPK